MKTTLLNNFDGIIKENESKKKQGVSK